MRDIIDLAIERQTALVRKYTDQLRPVLSDDPGVVYVHFLQLWGGDTEIAVASDTRVSRVRIGPDDPYSVSLVITWVKTHKNIQVFDYRAR